MPKYTQLQADYSKYRLDRAKEDLQAAHLLFSNSEYRAANNRAYYSIFHSMRALLVFDNFDTRKHSGIIAEFRRKYIKGQLLPVELSRMIGSAFTIRNASDYDDMFIASRNDTEEQINNAEFVYQTIESYIHDNILSEK